MNKTASMVMKIIGASLAFAAVICLLIGGWHDLSVGYSGMKKRLARKFGSEYDDYADEELYEGFKAPRGPPPVEWGPLFLRCAAAGQQKAAGQNFQPQPNSP